MRFDISQFCCGAKSVQVADDVKRGTVALVAPPISQQRKWLKALLHGQIISLLITGTAFFSAVLVADGIDIPTVQSSMNYAFLSLHIFWAIPTIRRDGLAAPLWKYALWAFVDVEANYLVVSAYQYTSVASVMLLDCFTIPCVMALSYVFLSAVYTPTHFAAGMIAVTGLTMSVLSDVLPGAAAVSLEGSAWLGDALVLSGAALYALSNVMQEQILKGSQKRCEVLGMLGLFGSVVSCIQAAVVEREPLLHISWTSRTLLSLLGFQLCLFGVYVLTSAFLLVNDAALFNLSLLTSDVYSVFVSWGFQHRRPTGMYCTAFVTTISGLVIYNLQPSVTTADMTEVETLSADITSPLLCGV